MDNNLLLSNVLFLLLLLLNKSEIHRKPVSVANSNTHGMASSFSIRLPEITHCSYNSVLTLN